MRIAICAILLLLAARGNSQSINEFRKSRDFKAKYQIDSAYIHMRKALKLSNKSAEKQKAQIYTHYGKLLKLKEKTDSSFYYYQKAAEIFNKYNNQDSLLYITISNAELFRFRSMIGNSALYIKRAEKMVTSKTPKDILAYYYNRRSAIEAMFFSKPYSLELSKKVIAMQDEINDKEIVIYSYNEMGYMYENINPKKSLAAYSAALKLAESHHLLIPKADILILLSRLPNVDEISYLEQAFEISRSVNNKDMMFNISKRLLYPYTIRKNYKKALEYSQIALKLEEEMYDSKTLAKTAEMERKYSLSKAEQALKLKNSEVANAEKNLLLTFIVTILALSVLFIVAFFLVKARKNNKKLERLSEENEFLLAEANHRINNNLQLIIILISDQARKVEIHEKENLNIILSKVESIATLHRHLYKSSDKHYIDGSNYLNELLTNLSELFSEQQIKTKFTIDNISLLNEQAIYIGLLLTELCINSLKYAFDGQEDKYITFDFVKEGTVFNFRFSDNGALLAGRDISPKMVERLCRQLKVTATINTDNGFLFYFEKKIN